MDENTEEQRQPSAGEMVKTLKKAVSEGSITPQQARQFREQLGITQSYFTRKHIPSAKRKKLRKLQKAARRANRK